MDNVKGILLILVLILAATTFLLFVQRGTMKSQVEGANILGAMTQDYLKVQGIRCNADAQQFRKIAECILPLLSMDDFKEASFKQPDERRDTIGYLVIENRGRKVYDSDSFVFYVNRERITTGCSVPGEIGHEITCRFDLPGTCEPGDVLEVYSSDILMFLKTC